jgi:thiol-disulfide isomerase/thioredoxin
MQPTHLIKKVCIVAVFVLLSIQAKAQIQVYIFVYPDCPVCRYYIPLVHQMAQNYSPALCMFNYVVPAENIPVKDQRSYKKELKKKLRYRNEKIIIDTYNTYVLQFKAGITPEVFVTDVNGNLQYSGAIDNKYITVANYRQQADEAYLSLALQALANNDSIKIKRTQPVGCIIP